MNQMTIKISRRRVLLAMSGAAAAAAFLKTISAPARSAAPPAKPSTPWPPAELRRLLAAARRQPGHFSNIPASKLWPAFILLSAETGLRRWEILALRRADVDFERGRLRLPAGHSKLGHDRCLPLSAETARAVHEAWASNPNHLFPNRFAAWSWYKRGWKAIVARAELPAARWRSPHLLRRVAALAPRAKGGA